MQARSHIPRLGERTRTSKLFQIENGGGSGDSATLKSVCLACMQSGLKILRFCKRYPSSLTSNLANIWQRSQAVKGWRIRAILFSSSTQDVRQTLNHMVRCQCLGNSIAAAQVAFPSALAYFYPRNARIPELSGQRIVSELQEGSSIHGFPVDAYCKRKMILQDV